MSTASFMAEHGARLADNGYAVIPVMPGAKVLSRSKNISPQILA